MTRVGKTPRIARWCFETGPYFKRGGLHMDKVELRYIVTALAAGAMLFITGCSRSTSQNVLASDKAEHLVARSNVVLACPGRTEGRTETVQVGAATDGIVKHVFVREGDPVAPGPKLTPIERQDI